MPDEFALNAEYRGLADDYLISFSPETGKRLDEVHARRVALAANLRPALRPPPVKEADRPSESAKRNDRRRVQRAAERARILEALQENDARSDRTLAKLLKVETRTVAKVRAEGKVIECRCGCKTCFTPRTARQVYADEGHRDWHRRTRK